MVNVAGNQILTKSKFREEKIYVDFLYAANCDCHKLQLKRKEAIDSEKPAWEYSVSINGKEISEDEFEIIELLFAKKKEMFDSHHDFEPIFL